MEKVFFFVSFLCFCAFLVISASADAPVNNLTCFNHTTNAQGQGVSTNDTNCQFCGYHSYTGVCAEPLRTDRKCFKKGQPVELPYDQGQKYTAMDQCFSTQTDKCIQYLRICDTDSCNFACSSSTIAQYSFALIACSLAVFGIKGFFSF